MELEGDFSLTVPLIFTALAVILATLWVKLRSAGEKQPSEESHEEEVKERVTETLEEEQIDKEDLAEEEVSERTEAVPVEEVGAAEGLTETKESETDATECGEKETTPSSQSSQEEDSKEEDVEPENDKILKISEADDEDDEDYSFKYLPGKLRGSDYEKMLTKDELEEEQRVQREQLGAIFKMMENNRETFGMMSEGDLKEQLKLYNM